jgi:tetratricopeptide (TPR) repeat protein
MTMQLPRREFWKGSQRRARAGRGADLPAILLVAACIIWAPMGTALADNDRLFVFDRANQLYEQGDYPAAIGAYQHLLEREGVSAALHFNLANAYFKNGQVGRAIAHYRLAERLSPRDPDTQENLQFARESVGTAAYPRRWQRWTRALTLNEITLAATGLVWLWCLAVAIGQVRREWQRPLRPYTMSVGILGFLALLWLGLAVQNRLGSVPAVVISNEAVARYGPFEESQGFFTLADGAELTISDKKGDWLQVNDSLKRTGWLQEHQVIVLPKG